MSCVLRAWGDAFDVAAFMANSPLRPEAIYENGDPATGESGSAGGREGFRLTVSDAGLDNLEAEILEAILFLDEHEDELRRLGSFPGVEGVSLDFGIRWRGAPAQTDSFPSDLLWRAGALDISLDVSHYPLTDSTSSPKLVS